MTYKRWFLCASLLMSLTACMSPYPNQAPLNSPFPQVQGQALSGETLMIPDDFRGEVTLLLLGYKQDSQFDIDRWLIGLDQTQTQVSVYELPTIKGMVPRMFKTSIDGGMRKGIPKELWGGVITIYKAGDQVQAFTGNTLPNNARVILLDKEGVIRYFYDRGFSVSALNNVREKIGSLTQ